jgi:flagellar biosynthesis GTPase FlhF
METPTAPAKAANGTAPVLQKESVVRTQTRPEGRNAVKSNPALHKATGYGLPCSQCHLYYPADLESCPTCTSNERVSPAESMAVLRVAEPADVVEAAPENSPIEQEKLEKEREEFLKQFKSQMLEAREEVIKAPAVCAFTERHSKSPEAATICKPCFDQLQERVDVFEAALHMDMKEAAQIVYDAVWADPSEPSKTYANAASALLNELRRRAGVSTLVGPFHPRGN